MSIDFSSIREIPNDPFGRLLANLRKKLSASLAKGQAEQIDNPEDIVADGQDVESKISYQTFSSQNRFDMDTDYYSIFEPDGDKVTLWYPMGSLGNTMADLSTYKNNGSIIGDPILVNGSPFDPGIHQGGVKSVALRLNRPTSPTENLEHIVVPDSTSTRVSGISTGISYFARFRVFSIAQQDGANRRIFSKLDDANAAVVISITSDGRLRFDLKRSGTWHRTQTPASTIAINTVYDVWCTYANSGDTIHIYVDGVDQTLTDPGADISLPTGTGLYIGQRGDSKGYLYGDVYDSRVYREMVVSSTEVTQHFTNKITIYDIAYGHCMMGNYWCSYVEPPGHGLIGSFDQVSYDPASFDTVNTGGTTQSFEPDSFEADSFETTA